MFYLIMFIFKFRKYFKKPFCWINLADPLINFRSFQIFAPLFAFHIHTQNYENNEKPEENNFVPKNPEEQKMDFSQTPGK